MAEIEGKLSPAARVNRALGLYVVVLLSVTLASWVNYISNPTFDRCPLFSQIDRFRDLINPAVR